jgi:ABC-type polysaccharide/polyol phosphate export permease
MTQFLYGMNTMGFLIAGLFFWRFWRKTADGLFIAFSAAFFLFSLDQLFHAAAAALSTSYSWSFSFRLAGFGLLIYAVLRKNIK